jgi:tetratricopeptide (TPR) repeat protein
MIKLSLIMKEEDAIALFNKSKHYCHLHKFKKSIKCLEEAIKLVPELAILWYSKGVVFGMEADELVREQMQMQLVKFGLC